MSSRDLGAPVEFWEVMKFSCLLQGGTMLVW